MSTLPEPLLATYASDLFQFGVRPTFNERKFCCRDSLREREIM